MSRFALVSHLQGHRAPVHDLRHERQAHLRCSATLLRFYRPLSPEAAFTGSRCAPFAQQASNPHFQTPIHKCGNHKLRHACNPYQCWPSGAFLSACPACRCVYVAHESASQEESMSRSDFRNSGAQCLSDFEPYHNQGLPSFYPSFTLMALFTPFLPRLYPVLEGKLCRGKKEGKTGVKQPIFY